jgi:hypothetical protein
LLSSIDDWVHHEDKGGDCSGDFGRGCIEIGEKTWRQDVVEATMPHIRR